MTTLAPEERHAITSADDQLRQLQTALEAAADAGALDSESFQRAVSTARDVVHRVNAELPPELDTESQNEIRRRLLALMTAPIPSDRLLDAADQILLEVEAVRHIFRDVLTEQPPVDDGDPAQVVRQLEKWLPGLTLAQIAELLGMSERTVQRRRVGEGPITARAQLVLRLVAILRHGWTDQGVYEWFRRSRTTLGGQPPEELLDDRASERRLITLARSGRVQSGE